MNKPTYLEIGNYVNKTERTIKSWKKDYTSLFEVTRLGAICKHNGITEEDLEALVQLKESIISNDSRCNIEEKSSD